MLYLLTAASFLFLEIDMSEVKFTSGKWVAEQHEPFSDWSVEANHDDEGFFDMICEEVSSEANAHLIAAAPEMYNLLERLANPNNCKKDIIHLLGEADSLLAKARGE